MNQYIEAFDEWLRNKNLKKRTVEEYIYYLFKFKFQRFNQESVSKFLSEKGNRNGVSRSFLLNFKKFLLSNKNQFKIDNEYAYEISEVELPSLTGRTKQRLITPLEHSDIKIIEDHLRTESLKLKLLLSYHGALRLGELFKIRVNSFNWDEWVTNTKDMGECRVLGKGDKEGICLIPPFIMFKLNDFIRSSPKRFPYKNTLLFIDESKGETFERMASYWQRKLNEAGLESGLTELDKQGKKIKETVVHPHRLRHSFANYLLKVKKVDITYIQEALRHSSISSTQIYTKVDISDLKSVLSKAQGDKIKDLEKPSSVTVKDSQAGSVKLQEHIRSEPVLSEAFFTP